MADGVDHVEMPTWKAFLIQLLNIAGTGPIFGALMGAVFGPVVFLWIVFGCVLGGAVHDYCTGMISLRMGQSGVVYDISTQLLGVVGGVLAIVGVVACPITSGDTAFRSARLTLAMFVLWAASIYLRRKAGKWACLMTAIPAFSMSGVCSTYILMSDEGLRLPMELSYPLGLLFAIGCAAIFFVRCYRREIARPGN